MPAKAAQGFATIVPLLATPPALRSELIRHIYSYTRPGVQRSFATTALRRLYQVPRFECFGRRAFSISSRRAAAEADISGPIVTSQDQPPRPTSRRVARFLLTSALFAGGFLVSFGMAVAPAAETINGFVNPPTNAETLTLFQPSTPTAIEVNEHIINHPLAVKLRSKPGMEESRPHLKIPPAMRPHNLTGGTLLGEGKIEVPPLTFQDTSGDLPELVQFSYVGTALCGHPGIIHGGLLATMLDEGLARACFPALPNKVGVTASLKIDYRVPCPADSYLVLKAQTTKVEGRKAWVKGWIEILGDDGADGTKLVEAEALFIEPKGAKNMARVYSTQ